MSLINQKVISLLLERFKSARIIIDLKHDEIQVVENEKLLKFFVDPDAGWNDRDPLLSILPVKVKTISAELCDFINHCAGDKPAAQVVGEDEIKTMGQSLTHHDFILCETEESRTNRMVYSVTSQLSKTDKAIGIVQVDQKVTAPYAEACDYADFLTIFTNGEFWCWESQNELVTGYYDFEAAFEDASF